MYHFDLLCLTWNEKNEEELRTKNDLLPNTIEGCIVVWRTKHAEDRQRKPRRKTGQLKERVLKTDRIAMPSWKCSTLD